MLDLLQPKFTLLNIPAMTLFKNKYHIESNRAQFWNYSSPGSYFITVNVHDRKNILGKIENKKMILSDAGKIVSEHFIKIPTYHKRIVLDEWIVMPDHFHCIIVLRQYGFDNGVSDIGDYDDRHGGVGGGEKPTHELVLPQDQYRRQRQKMLIPKIIGKLQMQTSKQINIINNTPGTKNWQNDYYDHIIRNDREFQRIKNYIRNNPANWNKKK